jgi:hypothetical protein
MACGRGICGRVVLVLTVAAGAVGGAMPGLFGAREAGASHDFPDDTVSKR